MNATEHFSVGFFHKEIELQALSLSLSTPSFIASWYAWSPGFESQETMHGTHL